MKNSIFKSAVFLASLGGLQMSCNANEELFINRIYEAAVRFANRTPNCSEQLKQVASMASKSYEERKGFYSNINKDTKREIGIGLAEMFFDRNHSDSVRTHVDVAKYLATTGVPLEAHYTNIIMEFDKIKNSNITHFIKKLFSMKALLRHIPKKEKEKIDRELERLKKEKGISEAGATNILSKKLG